MSGARRTIVAMDFFARIALVSVFVQTALLELEIVGRHDLVERGFAAGQNLAGLAVAVGYVYVSVQAVVSIGGRFGDKGERE